MIRIRGFARKTRRLTKGGSLPAAMREVSSPNGEPHTDPQRHLNMGNNGHNNGNGTNLVHRNGTADRNGATDRNGAASSNGLDHTVNGSNGNGNGNGNGDRNGVSAYLHRVVEDLVDSHPPIEGIPPLENNGHASAIDGQVVPKLETVFARAAIPIEAASPSPRWKRVFDVICVALTLPIWLPLLVLVMAWIKLVSPGPIFYRQERVGYRRGRFMIFKFRTMHVNAETRSHEEYFAHLMDTDSPMTKLDALDDSRLIRCGRVLRASGLDELPQVFNILRGEMSLVGPRPCLPKEFARYTPAQQQRANALPGLTGYWQVNGKNKTTFSQMVAMDIYYAQHMSIWLDIWIIAKTIPALISQTLEAKARRGSDAAALSPVSAPSLNGSARKI